MTLYCVKREQHRLDLTGLEEMVHTSKNELGTNFKYMAINNNTVY